MNIIEIIKSRYSCRTFNHVSLKPKDKKTLESFIIENSKGFENEVVNFRIIEKNDADKPLKWRFQHAGLDALTTVTLKKYPSKMGLKYQV